MRTAEDASKAITAGFLEQKIQGGAMNLSSTFSLEKMVISGKPRLTIEVNESSLTLQVPPAYYTPIRPDLGPVDRFVNPSPAI